MTTFLGKHFILESHFGNFHINKFKEQPRSMRLMLFTDSPTLKLNYVFIKNNPK